MTNLTNSLDSDHFDLTESLIDSTCSELDRLEPESREDTPAERAIASTKKQEDRALKLIQEAQALGANTLDLSNKGLIQIPNELLRLDHLEYLYLEGNRLSFLPDDFFEKLSNLVWLDLRNNTLSRLPTVHLKRHTRLKNLLLEKNNIRSLPLELGAVKTLNGLNISNNPLEFPPDTILERGTQEILKFLREMMAIKANGQLSHRNGDSGKASPGEEEEGAGDKQQQLPWQRRLPSRSLSSEATMETDLIGPVLQTAELHRPASYSQLKEQQNQKLKKLGALGTAGRKKSSTSVMSWKVNPYPEPPGADIAEMRMARERQDAKQKELVEKQETILQRRRDKATLKEWREESKRLQQKKYYECLIRGTKDFIDTAANAPFGVDEVHLKMMSNEDRLKEGFQNEKPRPVSPATRQRMEMEKTQRIQELERRIKDHTTSMVARRKKPKGSPQEEMQAAKRELEIAEDLQRELATRRRDLEYRFQAFSC